MAALIELMNLIPKEQRELASVLLNKVTNFATEREKFNKILGDSPVYRICRQAANTFGCLEMEMFSKLRKREVVNARMFVYVYTVRELAWSNSRAGKVFGKDHATVLNAIKVFDGWYQTDKTFREQYEQFKSILDDKPSNDVSKSASDTRAVPTDVLIHRTVDN